MYNIIRAEFSKGRRSSISKIVIDMPLASGMISFILMGGQIRAFKR